MCEPLQSVDVYSFGIVLWEIFMRAVPYADFTGDVYKLMSAIANNNLRPHLPPLSADAMLNTSPLYIDFRFRELIAACWAPSAADRPSFASICRTLDEIGVALEALPAAVPPRHELPAVGVIPR